MRKMKKQNKFKNKKVLIFSGAILGIILVVLATNLIAYFNSSEKTIRIGANIESVILSENGDKVFIKIRGQSDQEITKIKFNLKSGGKDYIYQTDKGIQEISIPLERGFWDWLFKRDLEGTYDYEISASEVGLENFDALEIVEVSFEYKDKDTNEIKETKVLDTETQIVSVSPSGSSPSSNGPSSDDGPGTTPDPTCSDNEQNQGETEIDCGGPCDACVNPIAQSDYVSYWKFENNTNDEQGINNGTWYGNPKYELRKANNYAIKLNGNNGIKINDSDSLDIENEISISAWVKYNNFYNYGKIVIKTFNDSQNQNPWELYSLDVRANSSNYFPRFIISEGINTSLGGVQDGPNSDYSLLLGEWYHIAGTYNGSESRIYINGELKKTKKINITIGTNDQSFFIGGVEGLGFSTNGSIDEVMIYNRALDESEILDIYNGQKDVGPVGNTYYLDESAIGGMNNGSDWANAWTSLSSAQANVVSGDTVLIRNGSYGTYSEGSVSRSDWVTYKADVGHNPEFNYIFINWNGPDNITYLRFDGLTIRALSGKYPINMQHTKYTQFLNLNVIGLGVKHHGRAFNARYSSHILINNSIFSGGNKTGRYDGFAEGVYTRDSNNITITNNEIMQFRGMGVFIPSTNNVISNNHIHNFAGDAGIFISGGDGGLIIENNEIHDIGLYYATIQEDPTTTTWNEDGTVMTNLNANWNATTEPFDWSSNMEIYVVSGNNSLLGDPEPNDFEILSVSPDGTQITLKNGISNGNGTPTNVTYQIRSGVHADLIQAGGTNIQNIILRGNKLYDSIDGWAFMHLQPQNSANPDLNIGGYNFTVENNLAWNSYIDGQEEYSAPLNVNFIDGVIFRNNTIIGRVQIKNDKNVIFTNNLVGYIQITDTTELIENDYNIINRGTLSASYPLGNNSLKLFPSHNWDDWNASVFTGLFYDYSSGNFTPASNMIVCNGSHSGTTQDVAWAGALPCPEQTLPSIKPTNMFVRLWNWIKNLLK